MHISWFLLALIKLCDYSNPYRWYKWFEVTSVTMCLLTVDVVSYSSPALLKVSSLNFQIQLFYVFIFLVKVPQSMEPNVWFIPTVLGMSLYSYDTPPICG